MEHATAARSQMEPTTLASSHRSLERIGPFVRVEDHAALTTVGRTFAQGAAVLTGFRRSIPERYKRQRAARGRLERLTLNALELHV
jgi:hypothetical protein